MAEFQQSDCAREKRSTPSGRYVPLTSIYSRNDRVVPGRHVSTVSRPARSMSRSAPRTSGCSSIRTSGWPSPPPLHPTLATCAARVHPVRASSGRPNEDDHRSLLGQNS